MLHSLQVNAFIIQSTLYCECPLGQPWLQFTKLFNVTVFLAVQHIGCKPSASARRIPSLLLCRYSAELWNIGVSLFIQDGPFFIVRSILMGHFRIFNQMLVFFTAKNVLVVTLQLYRLAVITLDFRSTVLQKSRKGEVCCCPCEPYEARAHAAGRQENEMKEFVAVPPKEESQAPSEDH